MAFPSADVISRQLANLLQYPIKRVRITNEVPPRISVIDLASAITNKDARHAAQDVGFVKARHPEVCQLLDDFKFPGRGQQMTSVTDLRGAIEFILLLPGRQAALVRHQAAELLVRYLGGDMGIIDEVVALHGLQRELAEDNSEGPRRIFGDAVAASGTDSTSPGNMHHLVQVCTQAINNAVPDIIEKLTVLIDQRLRQGCQKINLNVRAPKRAAPYETPIARDIAGAGRPLPLARFLDEKEIADPSWCGVRKTLAPFFGMQMQILKKNQLRDEGADAIYVEQNHRAQLLYTENDRELMEAAWQMMAAHREDLVRRSSAPLALPAPPPAVPNVLAMLQGRI